MSPRIRTQAEIEQLMSAIRQGRARVGPRTHAIALLLHGGRAEEPQPSRLRDISYLRMLPFAAAISRRSRGLIAPVLVHNTDGGWVAGSGSGVAQARELVRRLHDEHGLPIVLLGHSSGGWVALRVAGDPAVAGVVALAPWVSEGQSVRRLATTPLRVIHGDADEVCSPERSRALVERVQREGGDATWTAVPGGGHALMDPPWRWHALAARAVMEVATPAKGDQEAPVVDVTRSVGWVRAGGLDERRRRPGGSGRCRRSGGRS